MKQKFLSCLVLIEQKILQGIEFLARLGKISQELPCVKILARKILWKSNSPQVTSLDLTLEKSTSQSHKLRSLLNPVIIHVHTPNPSLLISEGKFPFPVLSLIKSNKIWSLPILKWLTWPDKTKSNVNLIKFTKVNAWNPLYREIDADPPDRTSLTQKVKMVKYQVNPFSAMVRERWIWLWSFERILFDHV